MKDVIELVMESGAKIFGKRIIVADDGVSGEATEFCKKFAEAIKRDLLDVGKEPVAYGIPPTALVSVIQLFSNKEAADYCAKTQLGGKVIPLFTAEQMAHSRSEAVSKQKEQFNAALMAARGYTYEHMVMELGNQGILPDICRIASQKE